MKPAPTKRERNAVYWIVRSALAKGVLKRPKACEKCRSKPPLSSNGRSRIHAHHRDYTKPLDVEWVCDSCHAKMTPHPNGRGKPNHGGKNGNAKLTWKQVKEIRRSDGMYGSRIRLAKKFGVTEGYVWRIRNNINRLRS